MGWFTKSAPKADPIGDICRLLVEKPWEWAQGGTALAHLSGVSISWSARPRDPAYPATGGNYNAATVRVEGVPVVCDIRQSDRIAVAVMQMAVARANRPRVSFDDATKAMAKAVLAGDAEAARLLADWVMEHCGGTKTEGA